MARKSLTKKRFFVLLKKTGFFYGGGEGICVKIKLFLTIKTKKNYNFCEYVYIYSWGKKNPEFFLNIKWTIPSKIHIFF